MKLHLRWIAIFVLCGNYPQLLLRATGKRCPISCSVMLSPNSHSSKSFLNVATIEKKLLANSCLSCGKLLAGECFTMRYITRPFEAMLRRLFELQGLIFFNDPTRLRCRATFIVLVQFITEQQDVAALQPGEAGGLGQLECMLCWLMMS